jgi:alpha-1,3/alpha-1,6-mannosyltransferase
VLLSINRFERKKGLPLALRCLAELRRTMGASGALVHLVLAGGYDPRLAENVEHLQELRDEADALGVSGAVTFVPSFRDEQKEALLAAATLVLYTPQARCRCEHEWCSRQSRLTRARVTCTE